MTYFLQERFKHRALSAQPIHTCLALLGPPFKADYNGTSYKLKNAFSVEIFNILCIHYPVFTVLQFLQHFLWHSCPDKYIFSCIWIQCKFSLFFQNSSGCYWGDIALLVCLFIIFSHSICFLMEQTYHHMFPNMTHIPSYVFRKRHTYHHMFSENDTYTTLCFPQKTNISPYVFYFSPTCHFIFSYRNFFKIM